mmetsp:Transcript_23246/g.34010  ORF Transcript_23246/g.34010 Transcript_23246/m.34010 type:complete len:146 (+) Transcript_23246:141-578(+)
MSDGSGSVLASLGQGVAEFQKPRIGLHPGIDRLAQRANGFIGTHDYLEILDKTRVIQGQKVDTDRVQIANFALKLQRPVLAFAHDATIAELGKDLSHMTQHRSHWRTSGPGLPIGGRQECHVFGQQLGNVRFVSFGDNLLNATDG